MGDDGTMGKGHEIYAGVQGEGRQAADGVQAVVFVGDEGDRTGLQGSGDRAGIAQAVAQPVGRDGRRGDGTGRAGCDGGAQTAAGGERGAAPGERDSDDGFGFFRSTARPDTALKAAYIDEHKGRFGVGPICRVLGKSLDCGFLTPRGYRMFRNRPPSRMSPATSVCVQLVVAGLVTMIFRVRQSMPTTEWS